MKVTINKVTRIGRESFVNFSTDFGSAIANWNADPPIVGEFYDVELDVMERIVWGVNAHRSLSDVPSIEVKNGAINLRGKIIFIEDGTAAVDVGGSVILMEVVGHSGNIPMFVDLKIKNISLFPTGV